MEHAMTNKNTTAPGLSSEDWAAGRGDKWLAQINQMEAMLAPVDAPLIDCLGLRGGREVADLGCGGGGTTLAVAAAADADACIYGYDVSPSLVAHAAARGAALRSRAQFAVGDSTTLTVDKPLDRIVSRFGTMFFAQPASAFANIASLLVPGGGIALAVWGPAVDNRWMSIVRETVTKFMTLPATPADAPGPMRYGDVDQLRILLTAASFRAITITDWRADLAIGGGLQPRAAAKFAIASMSAADALAHEGSALVERVTDALTIELEAHSVGGVVKLPARVHLVSAKR